MQKRVSHYLGTLETNEQNEIFVKQVQYLLRGTGCRIWQRGRNPNRKQFGIRAWRNSIPIACSSRVDLYLRPDVNYFSPEFPRMEKVGRAIFTNVLNVYKRNGTKINLIEKA